MTYRFFLCLLSPYSPTVTKFIRIGIADKNDNPPYFDKNLYEAEVDENEDIQHTVLTVTAKDHDECKCEPFMALRRASAPTPGDQTYASQAFLISQGCRRGRPSTPTTSLAGFAIFSRTHTGR